MVKSLPPREKMRLYLKVFLPFLMTFNLVVILAFWFSFFPPNPDGFFAPVWSSLFYRMHTNWSLYARYAVVAAIIAGVVYSIHRLSYIKGSARWVAGAALILSLPVQVAMLNALTITLWGH